MLGRHKVSDFMNMSEDKKYGNMHVWCGVWMFTAKNIGCKAWTKLVGIRSGPFLTRHYDALQRSNVLQRAPTSSTPLFGDIDYRTPRCLRHTDFYFENDLLICIYIG